MTHPQSQPNITERHLMAERDYLMERLEEATRLINEGSDTLVKLMNAEARIETLEAALQKIDETISGWERILCLPGAKEVKAIWKIASAALNNSEAGK